MVGLCSNGLFGFTICICRAIETIKGVFTPVVGNCFDALGFANVFTPRYGLLVFVATAKGTGHRRDESWGCAGGFFRFAPTFLVTFYFSLLL